MNLAPIVLFTYNRLWHTKQTVTALKENLFARESILYIFSDGYKDNSDKLYVEQVRSYIKEIQGFKEINIIEQPNNIGLANSIIQGVTQIINKFEKIIILEDDIITSPYFLKFMNESLNTYEKDLKVMHIGAYVPNIIFNQTIDIFFNRTMYCWGWATWKNRWKYFSRDINFIENKLNSKEIINQLNLDGYNTGVYEQFLNNKIGKIKTWAVFWYIHIFLEKGLCVIPTQSFTRNTGNDSSGENSIITNRYDTILNMNENINFNMNITEDLESLSQLKIFYKG